MPRVRALWRAGARLAAVIALLCLCAGGSLARPAPPAQPAKLPPADLPIALPPAPLQLAALEPADLADAAAGAASRGRAARSA